MTTTIEKSTSNRLIKEKSPYLLQHAHNPVDWYPWGEEAFNRAKEEDKPIFLSVGYSTCHWCHVMERESFEDEQVAKVLNDVFICIKVDREERPDIDTVYMAVCQAITGSGGWPLSVIMTSDKKAILAGTYYPKETKHGRIGIIDLAEAIRESWVNKRSTLIDTANEIEHYLQDMMTTSPIREQLTEAVLSNAYQGLAKRYDPKYGGFGTAPKFPSAHNLLYLLRYHKRTGEKDALEMVEHTLEQMARGGMNDHLGYGFHRYSTDQEWLLPHFEKMLYDQAMLSMAYLEAYQVTRNELYGDRAREIFSYVLRDMVSPEGGFYSAQDADSEGVEGKFYVWEQQELEAVLEPAEADIIIRVYNISTKGNYHDESTREYTGNNIFHLKHSIAEFAEKLGTGEKELKERLEEINKKLFYHREKRVHPYKDDKILTDWNGLMIAAMAIGGRVLGEEKYTQAARKGAQFILQHLRQSDGRLLKRYREGEAALPAHLDDYAFFIWGLLELYETSHEWSYIATAVELNQIIINHYWDNDLGGFFFTADDSEQLPVRPKELYDGAVPSGNSVAIMNNIRLSKITGNQELELYAKKTIEAFAGDIDNNPLAYTYTLAGLSLSLGPSKSQ